MKKIKLNEESCIGCGACMSIAPNNFTFGDDGISNLTSNEATSEAIEAAECCPVSAIEIIEDNKTCQCGNDCNCGDDCHCDENCCK